MTASNWARAVRPDTKLLVALAVMVAVVSTPQGVVWPHLGQFLLVVAALVAVRPARSWLRTGLLVELPFVVFIVLVPFVAQGPRIDLGWVSVSRPGLWDAWSLLAKATLGALTAITLASCTPPHQLVDGLARLRLPAQLVAIMSFMVRYLDVVLDQWQRMTIARASRGFRPSSPRSWPILARSLGTLFISCYERGERVHRAMISRGYTGTMPVTAQRKELPGWPLLLLPLAVAGLALGGRLVP